MFDDPFLDTLVGATIPAFLMGFFMWRFRRRIMTGALNTAFEVLPQEPVANLIERGMGAYLEVKQVDLGKGKMGTQYVLTDRSKAIMAVVAPYIMAAAMAELAKIQKKIAAGGGKGGGAGGIGGLISMFTGGGGGGDLMGMVTGFLSGGNKGGDASEGQSGKPWPPPGYK